MEININKTLTRNENGKIIVGKKTKTYESNRKIPITIILKPILDDCIQNYKPNKYNLFNESTAKVHTHMLRHTYTTRCIEAVVPAEVLQKLLGNKDISITINTYTTIFDKYKKDSLENYINYINNL